MPRFLPKVFYGWWVLLAASVAMALNGALYFYGFGTFFVPLERTFTASRTALSAIFALSRVESGLLGPVEGFFVDRLGARIVVLVGITLFGAGFILLSRADSFLYMAIVFVVFIALGASAGSGMALSALIMNWFVKKRGRAMGLLLAGLSVGGAIGVPLLAWFIENYGWRTAAVVAGLTIWVVGYPAALFMRYRPEQYGYRPDGEPPPSVASPATPGQPEKNTASSLAAPHPTTNADFTVRQALMTRAFWFVSLCHSVSLIVVSAVQVHLIPAMLGMGISLPVAGLMVGLMNLVAVGGRIGFGWLGDISDKRQIIALCLIIQFFALLALAWAQSLWQVVIFLVLFGAGYGGRAPLLQALRGDFFGRTSIATIMGFSGLVLVVGTVSGPVFAGYLYDLNQSYTLAFILLAFVNLIGIALILATQKPQLPQPKAAGR